MRSLQTLSTRSPASSSYVQVPTARSIRNRSPPARPAAGAAAARSGARRSPRLMALAVDADAVDGDLVGRVRSSRDEFHRQILSERVADVQPVHNAGDVERLADAVAAMRAVGRGRLAGAEQRHRAGKAFRMVFRLRAGRQVHIDVDDRGIRRTLDVLQIE